MPLTPEQKRQYIQSKGVNPDEWDIDETTFQWTKAAKKQPSLSETDTLTPPVKPANQTGALETFGKTALTEAIPTAASIAAGIGMPALIGSTVGPLGTIGGIGVGLVSALLGGLGARKLQEPFLPESLVKDVELGREEHPIASTLGSFAPAAVAFNPVKSIGQIPSLVKATSRGMRGGALSDREIGGLLNTGVNVGSGAGMNLYSQMTDDKPFDIGEFALHTGLSGILNEPTRVGRKLGIRGTEDIPENYVPGVPEQLSKEFESKLNIEKAKKIVLDRNDAERLAAENAKRIAENVEADQLAVKSKTPTGGPETMKYRYQESTPEQPKDTEPERLYNDRPDLVPEFREESARRGVVYKEVDELQAGGKAKRGAAIPEARTAIVSKKLATPDTPPHEYGGHIFVKDLLDSSIKGDKELAQRGIDTFGEEGLAQKIGEEVAGRTRMEKDASKIDNFTQWFKDFKLNIKNRIGATSDDEVARFIAQRIRYDAPYGSRREFLSPDILSRSPYTQAKTVMQGTKEEKDAGNIESSTPKFASELKNYDPKWRVTVQQDQQLGGGKTLPTGYVQVDFIEGGKNTRSTNIRQLIEEGYAIPVTETELRQLPQGQYTMEEAVQKIKRGIKWQDEDVKDDRQFLTTAEKEFSKPRPFGLTVGDDSALPIYSVKGKLEKSLPKDELDALREAGLDEWMKGKNRINVKELSKWIKENGPQLEVKKLDATLDTKDIDKRKADLTTLQHEWFDNLDTELATLVRRYQVEYFENPDAPVTTQKRREAIAKIPSYWADYQKEDFKFNLDKYVRLSKEVGESKDIFENQDSATANYQMVNPKPLKDMPGAVDILVRVPSKIISGTKPFIGEDGRQYVGVPETKVHKFEGHHFGDSDKNIVGWTRGYMETLPDGKKVFHVFELQSDWAQHIRNKRKYIEEGSFIPNDHQKDVMKNEKDATINYYESLALKAAIKHATDNGADFIAISDAETAMLTEGHDRTAEYPIGESGVTKKRIKQEPGMRLHYDNTIPNLLRKMTGDEGQKVSFGEHQNAVIREHESYDNVGGMVRHGNKNPRKDLVFKNPDGSPKTDVSARMFSLDKISPRIESGEPFGMFTKHYQDESAKTSLPKEHNRYGFAKPLESAVDKVRRISPPVADALDRFFARRDSFSGVWKNKPEQDLRELKESPETLTQAYNYIRSKFREEAEPNVSPQAKNIAESILKPLWADVRKVQNEEGLKIYDPKTGKFREAKQSDYYAPDMLSDEALDLFTRKASSREAEQAKEEWARYVEEESSGEVTYEEAIKNIREYTAALGGNKLYSIEFNALRKAQGYGLPESIRETNLLKVVSKYGRRAAQDLAYWKELQSNPKIAAALKLPKQDGGTVYDEDVPEIIQMPEVKNALKFVFNDFSHISNPRITSAARAVSNGLLGAATGIRDTVAVIANTAPYISSTKDVISYVKALGELSQARIKSLTTGARSGSMDLDRWMVLESPDKTTQFFNRMAEALRKYQGRDALEQFNRIYSFALGRELAKNAIARGDKEWIKKFGTLVDVEIDKIGEKELDQIAKNFVDRTQGTYDARGLPAGSFEGPLAPFLALSRWSIEKSNVIYKDVITPAITGKSFKPLLSYTLGTMLTGAAIRELNELMSGKKPQDASVKEALAAENTEHLVASIISLAQLGGYAGIMSDIAKGLSDLAISHETPRGLAFPLVDFATDTIGDGIKDYMTSVDAGANPLDAAQDLIWDVMRNSVQNIRLLNSKAIDSEGSERQNKFRDYRVFKKLEDEEVPSMGELRTATKYGEGDTRKFKRTEDISEAISLLPKLLEDAIEKSAGDPYKLKRELRKIKQNSYQTMPSPSEMPSQFLAYVEFLSKTQGSDKASERLMDYITQNSKNKVKSSMVPSL